MGALGEIFNQINEKNSERVNLAGGIEIQETAPLCETVMFLTMLVSKLIDFFFLEWPIRNTKDSGDDNFNLGQARPHRSTETAK